MNLKKELHHKEFQDLLSQISINLQSEIKDLEKKIKEKKSNLNEINTINKYFNNLPDTTPLEQIREWGHTFEEEVYAQDYLYPYEDKMTEHLYRHQNIYSTQEVLDIIPDISSISKEYLVNRFPVIKIWHDTCSSLECGNFVIEYYKYCLHISTRPDERYFNLYYSIGNKKGDIINILELYDDFEYESFDKLETYLDDKMENGFGTIIPKQFKLGLIIMAYFFYFQYKQNENTADCNLNSLKDLLRIHF